LSANADFGRRIRLEAFASAYDDMSSYEPEISAALEFSMNDPVECQFRIFASGKMLIPKVRSTDDCKKALTKLWELLDGFSMPDDADSGIPAPKLRGPRTTGGGKKRRRTAKQEEEDEEADAAEDNGADLDGFIDNENDFE
jgi:hypothetical protein